MVVEGHDRPTRPSAPVTDPTAAPIAVALRGITKTFPGVLANDHVDLEVRRGEIHALLGENGAGKSTLMSVLTGLYQPDQGRILIGDEAGRLRPVTIASPRDAIHLGIGMVHQHFKLVPTQTVAENVILGMDGVPFVLDMATVEAEVAALSERFRMPVPVSAYIWQISVGEQQRVEILKALYRGAEILILDEPTAVLTPQEAAEVAATLRALAAEGKAIIFISHKLDEVMTVADRVTVLRKGRNVATLDVAATDKHQLAELMVGREVATTIDKDDVEPGPVVLRIDGVVARNNRGIVALKDLSLEVRAGEILGVAGVAGNGQRELTEVVTGLRRAEQGTVTVDGDDLTDRAPVRFIDAGVSHVPSDRLGRGLAGNLPLADNMAMKAYRRPPIAAGPMLRRDRMRAFAVDLIERFNVDTPGPDTPARNLSGGNQQKAILAREITAGTRARERGRRPVLIAAYPTRGLDVGAIEDVRSHLLRQRSDGTAVLFISEELDELMMMSDRIAVLHGGEVMGVVTPAETTIEELGLMMAGEMRR